MIVDHRGLVAAENRVGLRARGQAGLNRAPRVPDEAIRRVTRADSERGD